MLYVILCFCVHSCSVMHIYALFVSDISNIVFFCPAKKDVVHVVKILHVLDPCRIVDSDLDFILM